MAGPPTPRTTAALVQGVNPGIDTSIDLTPFIAIANQLTTDVCGPNITGMDSQGNTVTVDSSYTDGFVGSKMELIERWLAAHFYGVYDNALVNARAGSVGATFQQKIDLGLKNTEYGQMAMFLDTSLRLAQLTNIQQTVRKVKIGGFYNGRRFHNFGDFDCGAAWADLTMEQ